MRFCWACVHLLLTLDILAVVWKSQESYGEKVGEKLGNIQVMEEIPETIYAEELLYFKLQFVAVAKKIESF